jgi:hypothetical protein
MRWIVGGKAAHGCAASPSQMGRFETRWLIAEKNLLGLADLSGHWIDMVHARRPARGVVLDMDSSVSPTHGEQEMSFWNGHYGCTCYHPLFLFNQFGDLERCVLRSGNVHSADGWKSVLKPVVERYKRKVSRIYFRADAGFASPDVYEFLEAERIKYAIRLPTNRRWDVDRNSVYRNLHIGGGFARITRVENEIQDGIFKLIGVHENCRQLLRGLYLQPDRTAQRLAPNFGHGRHELVNLHRLGMERLAS